MRIISLLCDHGDTLLDPDDRTESDLCSKNDIEEDIGEAIAGVSLGCIQARPCCADISLLRGCGEKAIEESFSADR